MKSPMIDNADYIKNKRNYSDLQVCKSAAGYYIGTIFTDPDDGFQEPGSRDSGYFATEREAQIELDLLEKDESNIVLREHP